MRSRRMKTWTPWLGAVTGLLLVLDPLSSVAEQRESPLQFWLNGASRESAGPNQFRPRPRAAFRPAARSGEMRNGPSVAAASKPRPKPDFVVAVFGDAFGAQLARGLTDAYAATPATLVDDRTADESELTAADLKNWDAGIDSERARVGRMDAALILLGGDDLQPLRNEHGGAEAPGSPAWRQLYGDRVEKLAAIFRDKRIPLIWVGLPIVRDDAEAKSYADLNAIVRERAPKGGAAFVDSWEAFADDNGQYSPTGPDMNGQIAKLRRNDGWDFTRAGARKLASFVEASLKHERDRAASSSELAAVPSANPDAFDQALSIDVNAQIRREAGLPVDGLGQTATTEPPPQEKPKIGPILSLNAPPLATGGGLADSAQPVASLAELERKSDGSMAGPHGRTDDFAWPVTQTPARH